MAAARLVPAALSSPWSHLSASTHVVWNNVAMGADDMSSVQPNVAAAYSISATQASYVSPPPKG